MSAQFFQHQERARRLSVWLLLLLVATTLTLIAVTSLALAFAFSLKNRQLDYVSLITLVAGIVTAGVVGGGLFKYLQLRAGGKVVAEQLGGRLINHAPDNEHERRLLNIVEEMALASGCPVPAVYVLDEPSINAFAAGHSDKDAAIGVTAGALRVLDRDELQAVVAHEFSHIFNGDMALNLRLVCMLNGLLIIGLAGRFLMRAGTATSATSRSTGNSQANMAAVLTGVGLCILGAVGLFVAGMIKSAINRQREYLADASAVQFTRQNAGIVGALKKIGGYGHHSYLATPYRDTYSHLFFGASGLGLLDWFPSHPPLEKRIRRFDKYWDGEFPMVITPVFEPPRVDRRAEINREPVSVAWDRAFNQANKPAIEPVVEVASLTVATPLEQARSALQGLAPRLLSAAHQPELAPWLVAGLLLHPLPSLRAEQESYLREHWLNAEQGEPLLSELAKLGPVERMPLLEISLSTLHLLPVEEGDQLLSGLYQLVRMDGRLDLREWLVFRRVECRVKTPKAVLGNQPLSAFVADLHVLLSFLSQVGYRDAEQAQAAYLSAWSQLQLRVEAPRWQPLDPQNAVALDRAVQRLRHVRPLAKPLLLRAMAYSIESDGQLSQPEIELMRTVAELIDCPMPSLLGQNLNGAWFAE